MLVEGHRLGLQTLAYADCSIRRVLRALACGLRLIPMSHEHTQDRGKLFEHAEKQKPSQPSFHGECTIDGTTYEIRGWRREDQLALSLAPPRGDKNTFPPDVFADSSTPHRQSQLEPVNVARRTPPTPFPAPRGPATS